LSGFDLKRYLFQSSLQIDNERARNQKAMSDRLKIIDPSEIKIASRNFREAI